MGKFRDYAPALKYGNKIYPEDLAGMIGLSSVGDVWYVDPGKTSGVSGSGTSRDDAFLTVTEALAAATADQDDVILLTPSNSTGRTTEAAAIDWSKRRTHLIGNTGPISLDARAGMSFSSAVVSPCFTVSTRSCIFKNFTMTTSADINVLALVTDDYNYFEGVHFAGIGNATTGDDTAARCLTLTGAEENRFVDCTFGLDTVARSTTNATVEFTSESSKNVFEGCKFVAYADNAGALFIKAASAANIGRYALFQKCMFHNAVNSAATAMTTAMSIHAAVGGTVILEDSWVHGATDWSDDFTAVYVSMVKPDTDEGGILLVAS